MTRFTLMPLALLTAIGLALLPAADTTAQEEPKTAPTDQEWQQVVDRAVHYLKSKQNPDGSWSREQSIGITGVVVDWVCCNAMSERMRSQPLMA